MQPVRAWFLEIVLPQTSVCVHACVCVCVCVPPEGINSSYVKHMHNNWIKQFYDFSISLLRDSIDKLNGYDLSNNACCECLPNKIKMTWY